MAFQDDLFMGIVVSFLAVAILYGLSHYLQLVKEWPKTKLKKQLYMSGETVEPRKRRYLEQTFIWLSYFSIVHVISFMIVTMMVFSVATLPSGFDIGFPLFYFVFVAFAVLTLAKRPAQAAKD